MKFKKKIHRYTLMIGCIGLCTFSTQSIYAQTYDIEKEKHIVSEIRKIMSIREYDSKEEKQIISDLRKRIPFVPDYSDLELYPYKVYVREGNARIIREYKPSYQFINMPEKEVDLEDGLSDTYTPETNDGISQEEIDRVLRETAGRPYGGIGRLLIPSVGINVGLNYSGIGMPYSEMQYITDLQDSALCIDYGEGACLVADHYNQGFEAIKSSVPGVTHMYITNGHCITKYVCIDFFNGHNNEDYILDEYGNPVHLQIQSDGLCLYTCNGCWQNVVVAEYVPVTTIYI